MKTCRHQWPMCPVLAFARLALLCLLMALAINVSAEPAAAPAEQSASLLSDAEIRKILVDRIDVQRKSVGIVVGLITPRARRVIAYGKPRDGDTRSLNGDSVFEIGSITKVFTSLLLADMVQHREVLLADPLASYLPDGMRVPTRSGRSITLVDLSTNTSGFPFWPANFPSVSDRGAFKTYSVEQLAQFLATFELPRDPGVQWEYSNMNGGLLGLALGRRLGVDYETAIQMRITGPLGMRSTGITLSPHMRGRMATGHDANLKPAPAWEVPMFAGAGSLRSTANDLLTFLENVMGQRPSTLAPAMAAMLDTQRPGLGFQQALGWMVLAYPQAEGIVTHDGGTSGYASSIAYDPETRVGVVVLSNAAASVSDIARHLLRQKLPLTPATQSKPRTEVAIDLGLFDRYAGRYQLGPGATVTVSREGDALIIQLPSAPKLRLRPESERDFFIAESPQTTFTFDADAAGRVTRLLLKAATGELAAARIEPVR